MYFGRQECSAVEAGYLTCWLAAAVQELYNHNATGKLCVQDEHYWKNILAEVRIVGQCFLRDGFEQRWEIYFSFSLSWHIFSFEKACSNKKLMIILVPNYNERSPNASHASQNVMPLPELQLSCQYLALAHQEVSIGPPDPANLCTYLHIIPGISIYVCRCNL